MKRGDLVVVAVPGDFGKPRPALVIQADRFDTTGTVALLLLTSTVDEPTFLRVDVRPTSPNGLRKTSQVMVDKIYSVPREKVGQTIGTLEDDVLLEVTRSLALFIGLS